ncbi:MAG: hypothetical protein AMXMBFR46_04260 [Acidimicrobiia bacterium]
MLVSRRPRGRLRWLWAAAATLAVAGTLVAAGATPAAAHTVGGIDASNYRTRILSVTPPHPDLRIAVIDNGARLELTNTGRHDVSVEGYEGEPYLRVGPRGAFENVRSPATFLNRVRRDPAPPPARADASAPPEWRRVSRTPTVRWHDHRAHWMGADDPPIVQRDPGREHLVQRFRLDLRVGDDVVKVRGDVRWIPGPSPWPWLALAAVLAVATVLGARTTAAGRVVGGVLGLSLVSSVVHAVGSWTYATNSLADRTGDALPTVAAVALGGWAMMRLARRGLHAAAPLLVFSGLFVGIAIGLADLSALSHSQLPTDLPAALDRLTITLALGGGFGVAAAAALHVASRPPAPAQVPGPESAPASDAEHPEAPVGATDPTHATDPTDATDATDATDRPDLR